jgi:hypothetical protein
MRRCAAARLLRLGSNPTGGMDVLWVLCCQVEVSAMSWSLFQRNPTDYGASSCVIYKPRDWGGPDPLGAVASKIKTCLLLGRQAITELILRSTVRRLQYIVQPFSVDCLGVPLALAVGWRGVSSECHASAALPSAKIPGTHYIRGWAGHAGGLGGCGE